MRCQPSLFTLPSFDGLLYHIDRINLTSWTVNMSGIMKPLQLLRNVRRDMISGRLEDGDYNPGLYRTIGSVTYYILPRRKNPRLNTFVLKKAVSTNIAERLADLGPVNTLFTFEVYANAAIIPSFTDAASLEDILVVRASWPFDPQHCRILVADVSRSQ